MRWKSSPCHAAHLVDVGQENGSGIIARAQHAQAQLPRSRRGGFRPVQADPRHSFGYAVRLVG
jgi:hypothetical protein